MSRAPSASESGRPLTLADGLALAASPTFAAMALLTGLRPEPMDWLCGAPQASPFHGMTAMYLMMSLFHAAPWLRRLRGETVPSS